jgi:glycerophosphoryl diester phosphodiesterase
MNPEYTAQEAVKEINHAVHNAYAMHGVKFDTLLPAERLQCSLLIYSVHRHEVWSFGDCMLRINQRDFRFRKEGDDLFAALRAFCIQIERDRRELAFKEQELSQSNPRSLSEEQELSQYGRAKILPYLKEYVSLANRAVPFGYDVIDGGPIYADHVKVYAVQKDDCIVMASDGYPKLFDTFEDTEEYLKQALKEDPTCIGILRGTKGVEPGNVSYDDRTYVSFRVV